MHKWISLLLALFILLLPSAAKAQTTDHFSTMEVDLWPEYDSPSMLVIYRITLSPSANLPSELSIRIPASAGKPTAVAARQIDGTLLNVPYSQTQAAEWSTLKFTATMPEIQIEYYDPSLVITGSARHFQFTWPGDYAIDELTIQVQRPVDASNMKISPSLGSGSSGKDGLFYFVALVGAFKAGQTYKVSIDYQKPNTTLSIENLPVKPSSPITDNTPFFARFSNILLWVLGGLGLILILVALGLLVYWLVSRKNEMETESPRRRRRSDRMVTAEAGVENQQGSESEVIPTEDGQEIYCPSCGKRASASDRFCRSCGKRLQVD